MGGHSDSRQRNPLPGNREEVGVSADEDWRRIAGGCIVAAPSERAGELHGVVGAQGMCAAESGGARKDCSIEIDNNVASADLLLEACNETVAVGGA